MFNLRRPSPYALAVGLLVAVGIYIRLVGNAFDPVGLWGDEAVWAERLLTKPLSELSIRPIAFMWLVRSSIELFGLSEFTLRLVSTIGGIGTLLLAPYLSRRILRSSSCQLIFIAIIAFHPALVDLSKEFKPYAWEVFVHASVLGLALRYEQKRNPWLALALVVALPLLFLSAYNITFAYPGIYLLFFGRAVIQARRRTPRARLAIATTVLSAVVALAAVGGLYKTSMKPATTKKTSSFWAKKYSSFYVEPSTRPKRSASSASRSRVYFTAVKYFHTTAFPGKTRNPWNMRRPDVEASLVSEPVIREMRGFDYVWWAALHLAGLIGFTRLRRWDRLLLLWLPLLVLAALGALGKWPPGAFRTNTFLILHVTLIGLWGLEYMTGHWPPRRAAAQAPRSSSADDTPPKSNETSSVRPDEPPPPFAAPTRRGRWSLALGAVTTVILTIVPQLIFDPHLYATKRWWTTNFYPTEIADAVVRRNQLEEQSGEGSRATDTPRQPASPSKRTMLIEAYGFPLRFYAKWMPAFKDMYQESFLERVHIRRVRSVTKYAKRHTRAGAPVWVLLSQAYHKDGKAKKLAAAYDVLVREDIADQHVLLLIKKRDAPKKKPKPPKNAEKKTPSAPSSPPKEQKTN